MRMCLTTVALIFSFFASSAVAQTPRWSRPICPEGGERSARCVLVIAISAPESDQSWVEAHARLVEGRTRISFHFSPDSRVRGSVYLTAGPRISDTLNVECRDQLCTARWHPTERQIEDLRREKRIALENRGVGGFREVFLIPRRGLMRGLQEIWDSGRR